MNFLICEKNQRHINKKIYGKTEWKYCPKCGSLLIKKVKENSKKRTPQKTIDNFVNRYGVEKLLEHIETCVIVGESFADWFNRVGKTRNGYKQDPTQWEKECKNYYNEGGLYCKSYSLVNLCKIHDERIKNTILYQKYLAA